MNRRIFGKKLAGVGLALGLGGMAKAAMEASSSVYPWWPRGAKKMLLSSEVLWADRTSLVDPDMALLTQAFLFPDGSKKTTSCTIDGDRALSMMNDFGTYYY